MELLQLRYFRTAAKMESITKAANFHCIPQPAMSQCIARIEQELGNIKLFDRRNNRIYLNDEGKTFLQYVDKALNALDDGILAMQEPKSDLSGNVNLLVLENRRFVLQCVSNFAEEHPNVSFSISHDFYSTRDIDYDLCISSQPSYGQLDSSTPLVREHIILAVHKSHPLASKEYVELQQLEHEKFVTTPAHTSLHALILESCRHEGFEPNIPYICDDPYFIRKYVSLEMGIAMAPQISWAGRFRENTVVRPIRNPEITTTSYLLWNDRRYHSPAVTSFRNYVLGQATRIPGNLL